jgi:hypothetical protein
MRAPRGKASRSGLGVPGVLDLDTLGQQVLATALPATAKDRPTALRFHPSAKTELALAGTLAWLIGAFHKCEMSRLKYAFRSRSQSRKAARAPRTSRIHRGNANGKPFFPRCSDGANVAEPRRNDKARRNPAIRARGRGRSLSPRAA